MPNIILIYSVSLPTNSPVMALSEYRIKCKNHLCIIPSATDDDVLILLLQFVRVSQRSMMIHTGCIHCLVFNCLRDRRPEVLASTDVCFINFS